MGKAFTIVFALVGVSLVALSVGEISNYLIEKHDEQVRARDFVEWQVYIQ